MSTSEPENLPSVSVIIPAFNEEKHIKATLTALLETDYPKNLLDIIVVDNNSTDSTADISKTLVSQVVILEEGHVGAVRNLGARLSNSEILVFLDADCIVDEGWISRGVNLLETDRSLVCGGSYKARQNANWVERLWLLENPEHPKIQADLLGGCIFIRAELFRSVGGFNEKMTSGEDSDLSERLREVGKIVKIFPELSVIHLGNPSTLSDFFTRQIWHSENYLKFIGRSISDYMFWMTLIFVIFFALFFIFLATKSYALMVLSLLITITLSSALSAKRILLTKYKPKKAYDLAGILFIDYLYLLARSVGLLKSLIPIKK